ncbi:hypothetical protein ACFLSQ_11755 [Bacteroidota bacterium]
MDKRINETDIIDDFISFEINQEIISCLHPLSTCPEKILCLALYKLLDCLNEFQAYDTEIISDIKFLLNDYFEALRANFKDDDLY